MSKVKTANRIIRPYLGIENFDNSLDGIQFKVNGELNSGKQYLNRSQFEDLRLSIEFRLVLATLERDAKEIGLNLSDLQLQLFAHSKTLSRVHTIRDWNLQSDDLEDLEFHSADLPDVFLDSRSGFEVRCALILGNQQSAAPLKVYEKGTWLSIVGWQVLPDQEVALFSPKPMDLSTKRSLGLDSKALVFVESKSKSIWAAAEIDDAITVWIDDDTLNQILMSRSSASKSIELLLARLALESLVTQISKALGEERRSPAELAEMLESNEIDSNAFTTFFERNKGTLSEQNDLAEAIELIKANPALAASKLESQVDIRGDIKRLIKEADG